MEISFRDLGDGLIEETQVSETGTPDTNGYSKTINVRVISVEQQRLSLTSQILSATTAKKSCELQLATFVKSLSDLDAKVKDSVAPQPNLSGPVLP